MSEVDEIPKVREDTIVVLTRHKGVLYAGGLRTKDFPDDQRLKSAAGALGRWILNPYFESKYPEEIARVKRNNARAKLHNAQVGQ